MFLMFLLMMEITNILLLTIKRESQVIKKIKDYFDLLSLAGKMLFSVQKAVSASARTVSNKHDAVQH